MAEAKTLSQYEAASSKRLKVSVLIILIIIPAAIAASMLSFHSVAGLFGP